MAGPVSAHWRQTVPTPMSQILAAARDAFHDYGFHGTATRDIAARAGVSLPTLYYHHENKQGLLVAVLDVGMSSVLAQVRAAIASTDSPTEQLSRAIEAVVLHRTIDHRLASVDGELRYLDTDNPQRQQYVAKRTEMEDLISDILRRGIDSGEFTMRAATDADVREMMRYLFGACRAVTDWYRPTGPRSADEIAAGYAAMSLRAVGATAAPRPTTPTPQQRS